MSDALLPMSEAARQPTTGRALSVLIVEDSPDDLELLVRELRRGGYALDYGEASTPDDLRAALARKRWDIVISDWSMPQFNGLDAFRIVKALDEDIPFIIVSGTIGEEIAVAALKAGVQDFMTKGKFARLIPAVERELREAAERRGRRAAEAEVARRREEIAAAAERYRLLFEASPLPMWVYDLESLAFRAVNDAAVEHYGYARERFLAMTIADIRPEEDLEALRASVAREGEGEGIEHSGIWRHRKADGTIIEVEITSHSIDFLGRRAKLVLANDVTERFEQERKIARLNRIRAVIGGISSAMLRLRNRKELLQEACRVAATEGVFPLAWITEIDGNVGQFELLAAHGEDPEAVAFVERAARDLLPAQDRPAARAVQTARPFVVNDLSNEPTMERIGAELQRHGFRAGAVFPLLASGRVVAVMGLMARERDFFDAEEVALLEWLTADLSYAIEHIEQSQRLDHLSYYDELTSLPNARLFADRLEQFINAAREGHGKVSVVVADLEHFTQVNDTLGRSAGDDLLRQVGQRFGACLREPYTLGRISADTFAAASPRDGEVVSTDLRDRMLDALTQPFQVEGDEVQLTAQLGIALFPTDGDDVDTVFTNAEAALKQAKSSGERYSYHSPELNARIAQRLALEQELRRAVEARQFVLHYQARVDLISGEVTGAEALVRWQHPDGRLIAPAEFIALCEETGLIVPLGSWVIDAVCAQQAAWIASGLNIVPVAINLSSVQFETGDLLQTVRDALARHSIEPRQLELELTESAVMNDSFAAAKTLNALRKLGVGLALDDFGTGYSSLAHLKRFPFNSVKIDRSFVTDLTRNAEDAAIATAIVAMAHRLELKVTAEGVETEGQFTYLRLQGCDEMQGNYFSPAVDAAAFGEQLRSGKRMVLPAPAPDDERTLLLVDDEQGIRAALTRVLRRDGYRILAASNPAEALELLAVNRVQVIISDQRMPGISGTEFLGTVKQLYPDTMRIILSGYTDLQVVTESVNRGAVFKFLTKPWDDELLREQVRDAFRRYRPDHGRAGDARS